MVIHDFIIPGMQKILMLKSERLPQEILVCRPISYVAIGMYFLMRMVVLLQIVVPERKLRKFGVRQS